MAGPPAENTGLRPAGHSYRDNVTIEATRRRARDARRTTSWLYRRANRMVKDLSDPL